MAKSSVLRCLHCSLEVEKRGEGYCYKKAGLVVSTRLESFNELQQAYETCTCPICGTEMEEAAFIE